MIWMVAVCALHALIFCTTLLLGLALAPSLLVLELCEPMMDFAHQREWYRTERAVLALSGIIYTANWCLVPYLVVDAFFTALFEWWLA